MRTPEETSAAYARLGAWLRDVRVARGFTQAQVAQIGQLSESRVRQIETGRVAVAKPSPVTLRKLEAALGVPQYSADAVLADLPTGVNLADLPPITMTTSDGRERVVYAGKVDTARLTEAAGQLAGKYLDKYPHTA